MKTYTARYIASMYNKWARYYDSDFENNGYNAPKTLFDSLSSEFNTAADDIKILDVGIGTGMLSRYFRMANPTCHITGIDISRKMLAKCRKKKIVNDLIQKDFQGKGLPFDDNHFDVVASSGVFELLNEPDKVISEMGRVLKPKGAFAFTVYADTPDYYSPNRHPDELIEGAIEKSKMHVNNKKRFLAFNHHGCDIFYNLYTGRKLGHS